MNQPGHSPESFTIVLQGNLRPETPEALRSVRATYPESEILLATWEGQPALPEFDLCDAVVTLPDPGPLASPPGDLPSNLRRQCISTRAGLLRASHRWIVKSRSDIVLCRGGLRPGEISLCPGMLAVWRNFTTDPAKTRSLFHPSDILQAACVETLLDYWPEHVPDDAAISGFLPEQWLFLRFLVQQGEIPDLHPRHLRLGFAEIHRHTLLFAKYIRILPAEVALLPPRLRDFLTDSQRDQNYRGTLAETVAIYTEIKRRGFLRRAGALFSRSAQP